MSFAGKRVVITGASTGLGAALARRFAADRADLALLARSADALASVADACRALGARVETVVGDVTVPDDCAALCDTAVARFGGIDVFIACAGIGMWTRFDEVTDPGVLARVMDVNYGGVVNGAFHALPHLKRSGGVFAAVSSVQGKVGVPYHTGYAASKHAVQGFCDSLRMELRGSGVAVSTVLAHWIAGTELRSRALGADGAARGASAHAHRAGAVPVDEMARRIHGAVRRRDRAVFIPGWLRGLAILAAIAPTLADRLIARRVDREANMTP